LIVFPTLAIHGVVGFEVAKDSPNSAKEETAQQY